MKKRLLTIFKLIYVVPLFFFIVFVRLILLAFFVVPFFLPIYAITGKDLLFLWIERTEKDLDILYNHLEPREV